MIILIFNLILIILYFVLLEYIFYKDNNVTTYTIFSILLSLNFAQSLYFDLDLKYYDSNKLYIYIINFFFIFLNGIFEYTHPFYILYFGFQHIINMKTIINASINSYDSDINKKKVNREKVNKQELDRGLDTINENSVLIDLPVITYSSTITK